MSPDVLKWAIMACLLAGLCWRSIRYNDLTLWGLAFIAWAAVSLIWAGDWREGIDQLIHVSVAFGLFVCFSSMRTDWIPGAALLSVAGALVLYAIYPEHWGTFHNVNFLTEFIAIGSALAWRVKWHRFLVYGYWPVFIGAAWFVFVESTSNIKWLLLAFGGLIVLRKIWLWSPFSAFMAVLVPANIAFWLGLFDGRDIGSSLSARFEIWCASVAMFLAHPMGVGFGSFNYSYEPFSEAYRAFASTISILDWPTIYPAVPHNEPLQVATELGLIGLAIGFVFVRKIKWNPALAVGAVLSLVGFPAHNAATAMLLVMALGMENPGTRALRPFRAVRYPITVVSTVALLFWAGITIKANAEYMAAVFAIKAEANPVKGFVANVAAVETYPLENSYRHQLVLTLRDVSHQEGVKIAPDAADLAWRISQTASPDQLGIRLARVEYLLNADRIEDGEAASLIDGMKRDRPHNAAVWAADAFYGAIVGDHARAAEALSRGYALPDSAQKEVFELVVKRLTEQTQ